MSFTVTLNKREELKGDELRARTRRAAEVLESCGWLFDEYISDKTREMLDTKTGESDVRDHCYLMIQAAADLKGHLQRIVQEQQLEDERQKRNERRFPES